MVVVVVVGYLEALVDTKDDEIKLPLRADLGALKEGRHTNTAAPRCDQTLAAIRIASDRTAADVLLDGIVDGRDVVGLGRRRNDVRLLEDALYSRDEWLVSDEWLAGWMDG